MRGRTSKDDLQFDPEIERTVRAIRKAVRLSKSVPPSAREQISSPAPSESERSNSPESSIMAELPERPKLGDYGLANQRGHLTHTFRPANPAAFDIKYRSEWVEGQTIRWDRNYEPT